MENSNLEDYRCICGKLLFKGVVLVSLVEIKCKRCSRVTSFGNLLGDQLLFCFLILVDGKGVIKDVCKGAEMTLRCKREDLIGSSIGNVCPMVHDHILKEKPKKKGNYYKLADNNFLLQDGKSLNAESYCISPEEENGLGYYIFSRLKLV
jgi:hypothetical protein